MRLALWLTIILLAAGCARMEMSAEMEARGCRVTCDLCINADVVCADQLDTKGLKLDDNIGEPGILNPTPDININVPIKK